MLLLRFEAGLAVVIDHGLALVRLPQALLLLRRELTFFQRLKIAVLVEPVGLEFLLHLFPPPVEMRLALDQLGGAAGQAAALHVEVLQRLLFAVVAVHTNAQLYLFKDFAPAVAKEPDRATWVLLFHSDGKEIRAELSLPDSIGEDGHIDGWRERIILGAQPFDDEIAPATPDFGPDPTIDVRRKA